MAGISWERSVRALVTVAQLGPAAAPAGGVTIAGIGGGIGIFGICTAMGLGRINRLFGNVWQC